MTDKEFLDFLQKQRDFEDEEKQQEQQAMRLAEALHNAAKREGVTPTKILERLSNSRDPKVAREAHRLLAGFSETNETSK